MSLPVRRHPRGWPWRGLLERAMLRRGQRRTVAELPRVVVPEPVLARLEAAYQRMPGSGRVLARVLRRGGVATADVSAAGAAAQMQPPAVAGQALRAPCPARGNSRIDRTVAGHVRRPRRMSR